jgi:sugar/nucleoside kinase (ribokinase family)
LFLSCEDGRRSVRWTTASTRVLQKEGVSTERVATDPRLATSYSTLLVAPNGERTILNYRGASHNLQVVDIGIRNLEADWFYITSLGGNLKLLEHLLKHANRHGIQVALDPGAGELEQVKKLRGLLPLVTVLKANFEELSQIFGGDDLRDTVVRASGVCPYVVGTNGSSGSYATYNGRLYQAGMYQKVKVADRTGANATSVVQKIGAKAGILKTDRFRRMKVQETEL